MIDEEINSIKLELGTYKVFKDQMVVGVIISEADETIVNDVFNYFEEAGKPFSVGAVIHKLNKLGYKSAKSFIRDIPR